MGGAGLGCFAFCEAAVKALGNGNTRTPLHSLVRDVHNGGFIDRGAVRVMVLPHDFGDFRIPQLPQPDSAESRVLLLRPRQIVQKSSTVDEIGIQHSPLLFKRRAKLVGKCRRGLTVGDQILIRPGCFQKRRTDYIIQIWFT